MYESTTAPDGWLLCDGTNGTPDLRNCFIKNCASGNESTTATGSGGVHTGNVSLSHNNTHNHASGRWDSFGGLSNALAHFNLSNSHNHGTWNTNTSFSSWLPPYYALSFVMKAA